MYVGRKVGAIAEAVKELDFEMTWGLPCGKNGRTCDILAMFSI
jgi:hypothetical protein